ncbi:MAG: hypothetical protein ACPIOQ_57920, partial [Promethearchaeia archaeon]
MTQLEPRTRPNALLFLGSGLTSASPPPRFPLADRLRRNPAIARTQLFKTGLSLPELCKDFRDRLG